MVGTKDTVSATCRVMFGHTIMEKGKPVECAILLAADGSDSVEQVKDKIAVSRRLPLLYDGAACEQGRENNVLCCK